jgi:hypothetical protein
MYSIVSLKAKASTSRLRTAVALLPLLSLMLVGCLGGDPNAAGSPESAERELFYALLSGDPGVTSYLSAASNKQLDAAAAALAPELEPSAARRAVLAAAGVPEPRSIASVKRVKESKDEVTLEAKLRDGRTVQTRWRREEGRWVADLSFATVGGT